MQANTACSYGRNPNNLGARGDPLFYRIARSPILRYIRLRSAAQAGCFHPLFSLLKFESQTSLCLSSNCRLQDSGTRVVSLTLKVYCLQSGCIGGVCRSRKQCSGAGRLNFGTERNLSTFDPHPRTRNKDRIICTNNAIKPCVSRQSYLERACDRLLEQDTSNRPFHQGFRNTQIRHPVLSFINLGSLAGSAWGIPLLHYREHQHLDRRLETSIWSFERFASRSRHHRFKSVLESISLRLSILDSPGVEHE